MDKIEYYYFFYFLPLLFAYWWGYSRRAKDLTFIPKLPITQKDKLNYLIFEAFKYEHKNVLDTIDRNIFSRQFNYNKVNYVVVLEKTIYGVWDWKAIKKVDDL
ncbi:hypothetical protein [Pedobacter sp. UBA4863]|uniref:hypothetical protein n=1 Tax=Pedobacter sp. UBA4863 TaxID=1947060 RepID=UPI0025D58275|nr:hypothetical protein [Pedobacter sp. UBA4863]